MICHRYELWLIHRQSKNNLGLDLLRTQRTATLRSWRWKNCCTHARVVVWRLTVHALHTHSTCSIEAYIYIYIFTRYLYIQLMIYPSQVAIYFGSNAKLWAIRFKSFIFMPTWLCLSKYICLDEGFANNDCSPPVPCLLVFQLGVAGFQSKGDKPSCGCQPTWGLEEERALCFVWHKLAPPRSVPQSVFSRVWETKNVFRVSTFVFWKRPNQLS